VQDLLGLEEGQLLTFDHPVGRPVDMEVNGGRKFSGRVVTTGKKRAFQVEEMRRPPYQGRTSGDESDAAGRRFRLKPAQQIEEGASARAPLFRSSSNRSRNTRRPSRSASRVLDMPSRSVSCRRNSAHGVLDGAKIFAARAFREGSDSRSRFAGCGRCESAQPARRAGRCPLHPVFECRGNQRVAQEFQQLPLLSSSSSEPGCRGWADLGIEGRGLLMFARVPQYHNRAGTIA